MRVLGGAVCLMVAAALARRAGAGEFPEEMVRWRPALDGPVFQGAGAGAWDCKIRERGWILVEDGIYHLYYTGYNPERSPRKLLGHATSRDGVQWARDPANPIVEGTWVEDVCVVHRDGEYTMVAEGRNDIAHLLTSPDGRHWTEKGPLDIRRTDGQPLSPGPYGTPTLWVEGPTWYLFYERGDRGVWVAASHDRQTWVNVQDDPVLARGPEPYDREAIALNQIVRRDGVYYAYYHANAHRPWGDWTTCIARSTDLIHWEKSPANPIIEHNTSSGILVEGPAGTRFYTMHPNVRVYDHPDSPQQRAGR